MWTPPVIDEVTGHPGNLTAIFRYSRARRATWGVQEAANTVMTQIGRLPAWIVGKKPVLILIGSPKLPLWPGLLAVAALVTVTVVAAWRRQTQVLWLVLLVVISGFAAAAFIDRIDGPDFSYLVDWISSIGVVLWIAVGVCLLTGRQRPIRSTLVTSGLAVLAVALAVSGTWNALAAPHFGSDTSPIVSRLAAGGRQWAAANHVRAVKLDFGFDPGLELGILGKGDGIALQFERHGITTKVDPVWRPGFGPSRIIRGPWSGPEVLVGTAYQPPPGSVRVATAGPYVLYAIRA
jgi:hypothetical protein